MDTTSAKRQDMPPPGGYQSINYKRVPAKTYFKGRTLIAAYLGMTAGASYLYYLSARDVRRDDIEKRSANFAIYPLLLAERDREYLKQLRRNREEEAKLMANVEGWQVGTYYGEPIYHTAPKDQLIEPNYADYFIHANFKDYAKRAHLALWS